ncbi:S-adenosyl-L-methionine-dependent methyltransferase, partial [Exidia glandulosa HHB12029]
KVARCVEDQFEFEEDETVLLDFACGTGLVSRALAPVCKSVVGADVNPSAIARYNARVVQQGLAPEEMRAVHVDQLGAEKFDVVVCSMAYHHFSSIASSTTQLAAYLKPGGALFVADLLRPAASKGSSKLLHVGGPIHLHGGKVEHPDGFTTDEMQNVFREAGLEDVQVKVVHVVEGGKGDWEVFLASGWAP